MLAFSKETGEAEMKGCFRELTEKALAWERIFQHLELEKYTILTMRVINSDNRESKEMWDTQVSTGAYLREASFFEKICGYTWMPLVLYFLMHDPL